MSGFLELDLQTTVSHHMGIGNGPMEGQPVLLTTDPSLQTVFIHIFNFPPLVSVLPPSLPKAPVMPGTPGVRAPLVEMPIFLLLPVACSPTLSPAYRVSRPPPRSSWFLSAVPSWALWLAL